MMAAQSLSCSAGSICLPRPSHANGFAALLRAPRHRPSGPRLAPPKFAADDVPTPSGTHLPSLQAVTPSVKATGSPFNAHSSGMVQAA
jgi:hypothetical protein